MNISIVTVFPEIHQTFISKSIIGRAVEKGILSFNIVAFSDFCQPKERIDEPTVGPGVGMILKPIVVERALEHCKEQLGPGLTIFFSPQGKRLSQPLLAECLDSLIKQKNISPRDHHQRNNDDNNYHNSPHLILVCPRYEGVDQRVEEHYADLMVSIGDVVTMGGDIPAQLFLEGLLRLIPGVVGKQESVEQDSFQGPFLDHPQYGLPVEWKEKTIPAILQSGNHAAIEQWRKEQAARKTIRSRFDWFAQSQPTEDNVALVQKHIPPHYVAIMHTQVMLKNGHVGETSIPSLDIHDIARASTTYGIKNFFIVSPLNDQQEIVGSFLKFWRSEEGRRYNESRAQAIECVKSVYSFQEMLAAIAEQEQGVKPYLVATSACKSQNLPVIDYYSQSVTWNKERPILLIFGTGQGLSSELLSQCDAILAPITGMTDYNHLSVRSAAAIILDRWLGLHPRYEKRD